MDFKALMKKVEGNRSLNSKGSNRIPEPNESIIGFVQTLDGERRLTYKAGLQLFLEEGLISSLPGNTRTWGAVAKVFPPLLQYVFCRGSDHGYHEKAYEAWGNQLLEHHGDPAKVESILTTPVITDPSEVVKLYRAFKEASAEEAAEVESSKG